MPRQLLPMSREIDIDEFATVLGEGASAVDVREPDEYDARHIPGVQLLPLSQIMARINEVPSERPVYVVCEHGARSLAVADALNDLGIEAVNVAGGTAAWETSGRPLNSNTA